jgi:hypothetical protein
MYPEVMEDLTPLIDVFEPWAAIQQERTLSLFRKPCLQEENRVE